MVGALPEGTRMAGFELSRVIGRGGFGITYLARHQATGEHYAIKEYLPEDFARRQSSGRVTSRPGHEDSYRRGRDAFLSEADILKDLPDRKGLVRVRSAFEKYDTAYCVMEYIEGDSLERMANRLIRHADLVPEPLLVDLSLAVLWALDALHAEDMIHRDVKPANVMLRRDTTPVVIDFGAARRLTRSADHQTIFTRSYAALEQFPPHMTKFERSFEEGPWSDLYSLSVVLYELVAHQLPPDAPTRAAAILGGKPDPYVPLAEQIAGTSREGQYSAHFLAAIDTGCDLMPRRRWRSAKDFAEKLAPGAWAEMKRADAGRSISTKGADGGRSDTPKPRSRLLLLILTGGLAVGAYFGVQYLDPSFGLEVIE